MGVLYYELNLGNDHGALAKPITQLFIWREEGLMHEDDWLTYKASRTAPGRLTYETFEDMTFAGNVVNRRTYPVQAVVTFQHKHSDGAELCIARAILALQEAGHNV